MIYLEGTNTPLFLLHSVTIGVDSYTEMTV